MSLCTDTQWERSHEDEVREWRNKSIKEEQVPIPDSGRNEISPGPQWKEPDETLILDFWLPKYQKEKDKERREGGREDGSMK